IEEARRIGECVASRIGVLLRVATFIVEDWVRSGLLVSSCTLRQTLLSQLVEAGPAPERPLASTMTIGLVTCDRREALRRALCSYAAMARDGAPPRFVIVDDTSDEHGRRATRFMLSAASPEPRIPVQYSVT